MTSRSGSDPSAGWARRACSPTPRSAEALAALGLPAPETGGSRWPTPCPQLWNIWNLASTSTSSSPGRNTVSVHADTADWPFEDDDDVWTPGWLGLHSIDYGDPELEDEEATIALSGLTRALLIRVLLATGSKPLAELRTELAEAAAEYDDLGADAWAAAPSGTATRSTRCSSG